MNDRINNTLGRIKSYTAVIEKGLIFEQSIVVTQYISKLENEITQLKLSLHETTVMGEKV